MYCRRPPVVDPREGMAAGLQGKDPRAQCLLIFCFAREGF